MSARLIIDSKSAHSRHNNKSGCGKTFLGAMAMPPTTVFLRGIFVQLLTVDAVAGAIAPSRLATMYCVGIVRAMTALWQYSSMVRAMNYTM